MYHSTPRDGCFSIWRRPRSRGAPGKFTIFPTDSCSSDDVNCRRLLGIEGLTLSSDGNVLYAFLQSAAIQDNRNKKSTARYTRHGRRSLASALCLYHLTVPGKRLVRVICAALKAKRSSYLPVTVIWARRVCNVIGIQFPNRAIVTGGALSRSIVPATYNIFVDYRNWRDPTYTTVTPRTRR